MRTYQYAGPPEVRTAAELRPEKRWNSIAVNTAGLATWRLAYHRGVSESWDPAAPGILRLPSGRLVRGRGLGHPMPDGPSPSFGVYLLGRRPPPFSWESRWIRWPDFRLPAEEADVLPALTEAWERAAAERVEIACKGGHGRTGTALACLAVLDGVPGAEAVAFVREHYDRHAVETPAQRRYVARWPGQR